MTAKRFTLLGDTNGGLDTVLETMVKDNGECLTHKECCDLLNELHEEKEYWKGNALNQSNFNQILLNELDLAQEQGYNVSDPFKRLMEDKND